MRSLWKPLVLAAGMAILACAAAPPSRPAPPEQAPAQPPIKHGQERLVTEKQPVLVREIISRPDGSPDAILSLSYDRSLGRIEKEELADAVTKSIREIRLYAFRESRLIEKRILDGENRLISRQTYAFTQEGRIETESTYDRRDTLQAISRYAYDKYGRRTEFTTLDAGQGLMASTRYVYQEDKLVKISLLGGGGRIEVEISLEYDHRGHKTAEIYKNAIGVVEKQIVYFYDPTGRLLEDRELSPAKALLGKNLYVYSGDSSAPAEIRRFDARGELRERILREYSFKDVQKIVYD